MATLTKERKLPEIYSNRKKPWFLRFLRRSQESKSTHKPPNDVDSPGSDAQILDNKAW